MNQGVWLAGSRRAWRPLGAGAVEQWVRAQPWEAGGQPLIVRVPTGSVPDLAAALGAELRANGFEPGWPEICVLRAEYCKTSVIRGLSAWMGIEVASRRHLAEAFSRLADEKPRLLVLELGVEADPNVWLDEMRQISDLLGKLDPPARITFIIAVSEKDLPVGGHRMDVAWPVDAVNCHDNQDRWQGYVHERVAWHVGCRLDLAFEMDPGVAGLQVGDDPGLENAFDKHSLHCLNRLPQKIADQVKVSVAPDRLSTETRMPLGQHGPDLRLVRVTPWLARALLLQNPQHPARRQLQAAVVCRPLAARLLSRCLELEQKIADKVEGHNVSYQPSEEVQKTHGRLQRDPNAIEHRITPRGVREVDGLFDLASLGEVLMAMNADLLTKDDAHDLRRVRNALAHGSPVGWSAITILDSLEARLR